MYNRSYKQFHFGGGDRWDKSNINVPLIVVVVSVKRFFSNRILIIIMIRYIELLSIHKVILSWQIKNQNHRSVVLTFYLKLYRRPQNSFPLHCIYIIRYRRVVRCVAVTFIILLCGQQFVCGTILLRFYTVVDDAYWHFTR